MYIYLMFLLCIFLTLLYQTVKVLLNNSLLDFNQNIHPYRGKSSRIVKINLFLNMDKLGTLIVSMWISSNGSFVLLIELLYGLFLNFERRHTSHFSAIFIYFNFSLIISMLKYPNLRCHNSILSSNCVILIHALISFSSKDIFLVELHNL